MSTPNAKNPVPIYLQLVDAFRQRIAKGVWRPGEAIPTLDELAAQFKVARLTARQAVQSLTQEGLLSPVRGRGTFVNGKPEGQRTISLHTSLADLAKVYEEIRPQALDMEESSRFPPLPPEAGRLGEEYVYMRRLHFLDEEPCSVISLYLLRSVFKLAPRRFRSRTIIPTMLRLPQIGLRHARQTVTIGSASAEIAHLLRIPAGSPIAHVEGLFKDAEDTVLYYVDVAYRGDWVRWEIDLMS